ncbi:MAG: hypothetical protein AAGA20_19800 [Planctomycetota bacterium]
MHPLRTAVLGGIAAAVAFSAPFVQEGGERLLSDRDMSKLSRELTDWFTALEERKGRLDAEEGLRKELDKINSKKLKDRNLLSSPSDLGQLIYLGNDYAKKQPRRGAGKISMRQLDGGKRGTVDYAAWFPAKYRPKDGPYRVIITIPEEGENPEQHIQENWVDGANRDKSIIVAPKMPGDATTWASGDGIRAVMLSFRGVIETFAVDFDRIYIGGRGRGGETAVAIANMFPDRFAGAFSWSGDAGEGIPAENLAHVPVYVSGGGANATALQERAKEAGIETVTLDPGGGETEILGWMDGVQRKAYPDSIKLIPGAPFPTGAYWVQIPALADPEGASIEATADRETNTITLNATGITEATIYLCDGIVDLDKPVTVIANGQKSVDQFSRSFRQFLNLLETGRVDPGRVFVASKQYSFQTVEESDG